MNTYHGIRVPSTSDSLGAFEIENPSSVFRVFCSGRTQIARGTFAVDASRLDQIRHYAYTSITTLGVINNQALINGNFAYRFTACTELTGIAAGRPGEKITIRNDKATDMILRHNNAGSIAANRFGLPGATDLTIPPYGMVELQYWNYNQWELISKNF